LLAAASAAELKRSTLTGFVPAWEMPLKSLPQREREETAEASVTHAEQPGLQESLRAGS
jgi:hypothetical protein